MSPAVPSQAQPHPHSTPSPHMHTGSLSSVTSPPATPASSSGPGASRSERNILDIGAVPFIPKRAITLKTPFGKEIDLNSQRPSLPSPVAPNSPARRTPVRIETEEAKAKRMAEEDRAKKEGEEKSRKEVEERERKQLEEDKKKREELEEQERVKKAAEEKAKAQKEAEEKERIRKEAEEQERLRKEEEERQEKLRKEEEKERVRQEEVERVRREAEEVEKARREAEEKVKSEAAVAVAATTAPEVESEPLVDELIEEGEVEEPADEQKADTPDESKEKSPEKASLRIDTSLFNTDGSKRRPGPLDLSGAKPTNLVVARPSQLANARHIDDFSVVNYPDGVSSPVAENAPAAHKPRHYSRDFLMQFMGICKEKPDNLPPLDVLGLQPDQSQIARGGSGRRQASVSGNMGPPASATRAQPGMSGLGISGLSKSGGGGFNMGQFATQANKLSSDERFAMSSRSTSVSSTGPGGMPFGRPTPMVRSSSQGGPGGTGMGHRTRSKRGEKRGESKSNINPGQSSSFGPSGNSQYNNMGGPLEPVAPLEVSANRWQPAAKKGPVTVDQDSPEVVERKVKGLLNKLTMERFDSISNQIIDWANKSEAEKDGRTLIQVIKLVFEKATDEATWSEMYARLCRKMMEQISAKVQDDGIRSSDGKPITGGHLFRKYLLNRCQEDFERGWAAKDAAQAAAASKATEDEAAAKVNAENKDSGNGEDVLYSEEYYISQKAKRQGLGLVKFIGELFKLQMLTERIMHECVKKLLHNVENPEEEEIESLCKLMITVGALLDVPKARAHMDVYFQRMKELVRGTNVNSRMQFMLQDVIELRERKWIPRNQVAAPTTIAAVHEAAAKEKAAAETYNRNVSMSRGGSRRGADRGEQVGPDGWNQVPRPQSKVGDLSQFGKIQKTTSMSFGPSNAFEKKGTTKSRESTISRTNSTNAFSILSQGSESVAEPPATTKPSRPASRKPSVDLGAAGVPEVPLQRRKLNLLPRTVKSEDKDTPAASAVNSEDDASEAGPSMTEAEAKKQVEEDIKEFFSVRDLDEAEVYFTKLPTEHRHRLVDKLISDAIERKEADSELVAGLFSRAASKNFCSPATFEEGFAPIAEFLDDIAVDVPKAFSLYATMMKGAGLDKDDERRARLVGAHGDNLLSLLS
ncbi:hypothetical protein EUX98_g1117 [Antrodiella citrinella]|uniref:MI domain-containing protein n=1 Tax=Antrodiella citrinella TaxID=2447956 RepID=A0A4S4NAY0_9APHY|nr:hypothetical protein EUX98_g1117 [Antrodiella citrinella]